MIVQWALKGMRLDDDGAARRILTDGHGLISNWGRVSGRMDLSKVPDVLTDAGLDLHVNGFDDEEVRRSTPFISLSCGTVSRDAFLRTNIARTALRTALEFGFDAGRCRTAYVFVCWVVLAPRPAAAVAGVAEEVRDLTAYRKWSRYQPEGEVTAKLWIPSNQIREFQRWEWDRAAGRLHRAQIVRNAAFVEPEMLSNVREVI